MPGTLSNADINFPSFTGSTEKQLQEVESYLYMLLENLRYSLANIGTENMNSDELDKIIKMSAEQIDLTGYVTFNSLAEEGQTIINGSNITTGTISADRINLTGAITWSKLSSGVQSEINGKTDSSDVTTIITSTLVSSPNIAGAKYHDIDMDSTLDITSSTGFIEMLYGEADPTSVADSAFGIIQFASNRIGHLYLGGIEVMHAGGHTMTSVAIDPTCTFEGKVQLTSGVSYGTSLPSVGSSATGDLFFLI